MFINIFFQYEYESLVQGLGSPIALGSLYELSSSNPWSVSLETYFTERAIEMRIPWNTRARDRFFFSADLIPPVEICYLYGPTQ